MRRIRLVFLLMASTGILSGWAKGHAGLPDIFATAHSVFVESRDGDITDIHLDRADRDAILDVEDGITDWGRYALSRSRLDADLILVVRKGRLIRDAPSGAAGSPISIGHPTTQPADASTRPGDPSPSNGPTMEKDKLEVYTLQADGKLKGPLWSRDLEGGLNAPQNRLLKDLEYDIDKAFPKAPAKGANTP